MTDVGRRGDDPATVSNHLHHAAAREAGELEGSGGPGASSSGWAMAAASSTGLRRTRVRHVPAHRRAFHRFYREHFGLVYSMVRRCGVPSSQHDDAVQEVWLVAFRRLHTLEPHASPKAWLSTIARRVASRLRRTEHRKHRKLAALYEASDRPRVASPARVEPHDARRLLDDLLAALDDDQRTVLVLAQVHGLSGPELAQALEVPLNTAYSRLRLARRRVERFAAEVGADEADVIATLRRDEAPPSHAAQRAWLALVPELWPALGGTVATAGTQGLGLGGLAGLKTTALVVIASVVGLVSVRAIVDARAARGEDDGVAAHGHAAEVSPSPVHAHAAAPEHADEATSLPASASEGPAPRVAASPSGAPASSRTSGARGLEGAPLPASSTSLAAEAELLGRAQQALRRGDGEAALRLLDEHERRFPAGELHDERRGARVRALCSLGRTAQARAEARQLQRDRPSSPVAAGVADACS